MTKLIPALALTFALVASSVGCANKNASTANSQEPALNEAVTDLDVAPMPPQEPEVTFTAPPEAAEPVVAPAAPAAETPVVTETPAAGEAGNGPGSTYTVQKGDTLFSIARQAYGNGGQWQRIANANPGLSPSTLKAGTKIAIP